jgi:hypothetical protein
MDRDPSANIIDSEDDKTPSTGHSDTGEHGDERARKAANKGEDEDRGTIPPQPDKVPLNPD